MDSDGEHNPMPAAPASPSRAFMLRSGPKLVLALLALAYVCNVADRLLLSILAQDIKSDLKLSDWEIGLLVGPAIAFFYAILGIPMAYVADRVHRVRFLAVCLALWSVLTAAGGAAGNAVQLALTRIGVSAVEAGGSPASSSILADYFEPRSRPAAMGIYSAASTIGVLVSFALGGLLNGHIGWRWTLVVAGVPGILLALLLITFVREPLRGSRDRDAAGRPITRRAPRALFASLMELSRLDFYRKVAIAAGVSNFCFTTILSWSPSIVMRKFYAGSGHAGVALGFGLAIFGATAAVVAGRVTSRLVKEGMARPLRIAAFFQLFSAPLILAGLFSNSLPLCVGLICLAYGFQSFFVPIYWAVSQSHVPSDMRAMSSALMLLSIAICGHGIAPPVVGALSDALRPSFGQASLQYAVACSLVVNLFAAWLFLRASRAPAAQCESAF